MSGDPPAKRARTSPQTSNDAPPQEHALMLLRRHLSTGSTVEDAITAMTEDDDSLRDALLSCIRSSDELRDDHAALAALLVTAPAVTRAAKPATPSIAKATVANTDSVAIGSDDAIRDSDDELAVSAESAVMLAAIRAALSRGVSIETAVTAALGGRTALAAPVHAALRAAPRLCEDARALAELCEAVADAAQVSTRPRLALSLRGFSDVAALVSRARSVVVLAGAGVSVSCGIPDFRSAGGLYDTVRQRFGVPDPQAVFDLGEFRLDPALFYAFAREVMPSADVVPSPTHRFIAELARRGRLRRAYTQNIDGLEQRAGVPATNLVTCHGSFLSATCMRPTCRQTYESDFFAEKVARGDIPLCEVCNAPSAKQRAKGSDSESDDDGTDEAASRGVLKPDIVFFGEELPPRVNDCLEEDLHRSDLLLVLGTSLQVAPVARIPDFFPPHLPRVLVNRELVDYRFDVELLGNCDTVVGHLRDHLGWDCKPGEPVSLVPSASAFVPPRRFIFEGSTVSKNDPVKDDDVHLGSALEAMLNVLGDSESEGSDTEERVEEMGDPSDVGATAPSVKTGSMQEGEPSVARADNGDVSELEGISNNLKK